MKVKTSVTLSRELLAAIEKRCHGESSRSEFLERAAWDVLRAAERTERDARETAILNAIADGKLGELPDVLDYSIPHSQLGDEFSEDDFVASTR
jgi:metal-responsive CopG/Arc/MetJ family transcriptional regulator